MRRPGGAAAVLDGFHLEKQLLKLAPCWKKEDHAPVVEEFRKTIRDRTKSDFKELVEQREKEMPKGWKRSESEKAAGYILSNWTAAKLRLCHKDGVLGSSTESHVSHILSARMSSRPMGWSRQGAGKMAELQVYYFNGGDMLELVRYQKRDQPDALEEEKPVLSSTQILRSERNRHGELGKYMESICHSMSDQIKKKVYFQARIIGM